MGKWRPGALGLLVCCLAACGGPASAPSPATPAPHLTPSPARKAATVTLPTPTPPYSQEHVGKGKYQLINNYTYQFVAVTAHGARSICRGTTGARCTDYLKIGVTEYSGNTQVTVAPKEFALVSAAGNRYGPAPVREASRVVPAFEVLRTQVLHPDDDGDYATGTLVFLVPPGAGRFSLQWRGHHVATFVKPTRGKLFETR